MIAHAPVLLLQLPAGGCD